MMTTTINNHQQQSITTFRDFQVFLRETLMNLAKGNRRNGIANRRHLKMTTSNSTTTSQPSTSSPHPLFTSTRNVPFFEMMKRFIIDSDLTLSSPLKTKPYTYLKIHNYINPNIINFNTLRSTSNDGIESAPTFTPTDKSFNDYFISIVKKPHSQTEEPIEPLLGNSNSNSNNNIIFISHQHRIKKEEDLSKLLISLSQQLPDNSLLDFINNYYILINPTKLLLPSAASLNTNITTSQFKLLLSFPIFMKSGYYTYITTLNNFLEECETKSHLIEKAFGGYEHQFDDNNNNNNIDNNDNNSIAVSLAPVHLQHYKNQLATQRDLFLQNANIILRNSLSENLCYHIEYNLKYYREGKPCLDSLNSLRILINDQIPAEERKNLLFNRKTYMELLTNTTWDTIDYAQKPDNKYDINTSHFLFSEEKIRFLLYKMMGLYGGEAYHEIPSLFQNINTKNCNCNKNTPSININKNIINPEDIKMTIGFPTELIHLNPHVTNPNQDIDNISHSTNINTYAPLSRKSQYTTPLTQFINKTTMMTHKNSNDAWSNGNVDKSETLCFLCGKCTSSFQNIRNLMDQPLLSDSPCSFVLHGRPVDGWQANYFDYRRINETQVNGMGYDESYQVITCPNFHLEQYNKKDNFVKQELRDIIDVIRKGTGLPPVSIRSRKKEALDLFNSIMRWMTNDPINGSLILAEREYDRVQLGLFEEIDDDHDEDCENDI